MKIEFPAQASDDPAYWHPNIADITVMQQANLIILNGTSYGQGIHNVTLPLSRIVYSSRGFEDRLIPLQETVMHSHGPAGEHEHSGTAFTTWMDLSLAVEQAKAVFQALSNSWPEYQQQFKNRFDKLASDLLNIDEQIANTISRVPIKPVVFSHPVYQYIQLRYRTNGKSLHWEPDEMPDEKMYNELMEMLKEHPAKWMIWEGQPLKSI